MRRYQSGIAIGEIHELREREREAGIKPDLEVDAFMKASVRLGKRYNIRTDYVLRLLGLEVGSFRVLYCTRSAESGCSCVCSSGCVTTCSPIPCCSCWA